MVVPFFPCAGKLTEERDLWSSAAYTLSLKVTDKHSLNTAKKLHLCEKAWAKLSRHFAIFLSEKDSVQVCRTLFFLSLSNMIYLLFSSRVFTNLIVLLDLFTAFSFLILLKFLSLCSVVCSFLPEMYHFPCLFFGLES